MPLKRILNSKHKGIEGKKDINLETDKTWEHPTLFFDLSSMEYIIYKIGKKQIFI